MSVRGGMGWIGGKGWTRVPRLRPILAILPILPVQR